MTFELGDRFETHASAKVKLFDYIEVFYNQERTRRWATSAQPNSRGQYGWTRQQLNQPVHRNGAIPERLIEAAGKVDPLAHLAALLGADAGLRMGEMIALEWSDIDFRRNLLTVARSDWRGKVGLPKGGKSRKVPMTRRLAAALSTARHLRGPRVLYRHDGRPLSVGTIRYYMAKAQKRAGLRVVDGRTLGELHILRHTFCSRLAMRGATAKSIQELAGHQHLSTTQRYMHLSPAARESAIRLLDTPAKKLGDGPETGASEAPQQ